MPNQEVIFTHTNHIAHIQLNRPQARNAFNRAMIQQWAAALEECIRNDDIRVVVVSGKGRHFCSGGDIKEMRDDLQANAASHKSKIYDGVHQIPRALMRLDKPVIAMVQGAATGAGLDMALQCDIRFAGESAKLAASYIKVALAPGDGSAWLLPRFVGKAKALELLWTGDFLNAEQALDMGLVNRVIADDQLEAEVMAFATQLANGPQAVTRLIKRAVEQSERMDFGSHLDLISSQFGIAATSPDHQEAVNAFVEKRPASFK